MKALWDSIKAQEKAARAVERGETVASTSSMLGQVSAGLPPLSRALKLQAKAAEVGFDWPDLAPVIGKVREETDEIEEALRAPVVDADARQEEIGDLLFAVVNLARHAGVDPDKAMSAANMKFARRFGAVEAGLAKAGKTPAQSDLAEMDAYWDAVKRAERIER